MLQLRYNDWSEDIKNKWGTLGSYLPVFPLQKPPPQTIHSKENYLLKYRLRWGRPDRLSVLRPYKGSIDEIPILDDPDSLPIPAADYFRADTPPHLISIIVNDWPYSGTGGLFSPTKLLLIYPTQFRPRSNTVLSGPVNQSSILTLSNPPYLSASRPMACGDSPV